MWPLRIAAVLAALTGNATHIYLGALTIVGGWPAFVAQFKKQFELTACFSCSVETSIFMYVIWYGGPFYLLSIAAFLTRSVRTIIATILAIGGLIALDIAWYYSGNSKDWYVVLAPFVLSGIALAGLIVLFLVNRATRGRDEPKGASPA